MNTNLPENVTRTIGRTTLYLKKYSPEILLAGGIVGVVVAAVMGAKAHKRAEEALATEKYDIDYIQEEVAPLLNPEDAEQVQAYKATIMQAYVKYGLGLARVYGPAVALGIASIASIVGSHGIMERRATSLAAAYSLLQEGFTQYRERVKEELGEEKEDQLRYGYSLKKEKVDGVDENGKKTKQTIMRRFGPEEVSDYARFFDPTSTEWTTDPFYNLKFLKERQNWCNDKLRIDGHLFLNYVYLQLGMDETPEGQIVGWIYDENEKYGDNFVDFGIYKPRNSEFVNGLEESALLDFNVMGPMYSLI